MRGLICVLIALLAFACNGGEERLRTATPAASPSATPAPSAEYLPKVSLTERGVYLIRPDGTDLRSLTPGEEYFYRFSWSPDGSRIAVVTSACNAPRVSVVDVDSGDAVEVAAFDGSAGGQPWVVGWPLWSPDGRQLAVPAWPYEDNAPYHAFLVNADGSSEPVEPFQGLPLGWSPDGKSLAFWGQSDEGGTLNIFDVATSTSTVIGGGWSIGPLAWSPDGQRIAYSVSSTDTSPKEIVVTDGDGGNGRVVVEGGSEPAWSPDSKYLAFSEGISPYEWVAVAPADGSQDYVRLAPGEEFKWSPTGDAILIRQESSLRLMSLATHQAVDLVSDVLPGLGMSFSPDGQRVAFGGSDQDDEYPSALFVVNTDGTGLQKLARPSTIIDWRFEWSPDGRYIAFDDTIVGSCV